MKNTRTYPLRAWNMAFWVSFGMLITRLVFALADVIATARPDLMPLPPRNAMDVGFRIAVSVIPLVALFLILRHLTRRGVPFASSFLVRSLSRPWGTILAVGLITLTTVALTEYAITFHVYHSGTTTDDGVVIQWAPGRFLNILGGLVAPTLTLWCLFSGRKSNRRTESPAGQAGAMSTLMDAWRHELLWRHQLSYSTVKELETHALDEARALREAGHGETEALAIALQKMGAPEVVAEEIKRFNPNEGWGVRVLCMVLGALFLHLSSITSQCTYWALGVVDWALRVLALSVLESGPGFGPVFADPHARSILVLVVGGSTSFALVYLAGTGWLFRVLLAVGKLGMSHLTIATIAFHAFAVIAPFCASLWNMGSNPALLAQIAPMMVSTIWVMAWPAILCLSATRLARRHWVFAQ